MMSDQVAPFVHELCRMDRFGGRCTQRELGVWEIADISQWSEDQVIALHRRFPSISVRVEASRQSLSGFCVILQQNRASHAWMAVLVCAIMVSVVFSFAHFVTIHS
jgi:hypothetical protein